MTKIDLSKTTKNFTAQFKNKFNETAKKHVERMAEARRLSSSTKKKQFTTSFSPRTTLYKPADTIKRDPSRKSNYSYQALNTYDGRYSTAQNPKRIMTSTMKTFKVASLQGKSPKAVKSPDLRKSTELIKKT